MITLQVDRAAAENLVDTYLTLGMSTPGTRFIRDPGFRACTGPFEHPICNFAADLKLTPDGAARLQDLAISRPSFNVYSLPGDTPWDVEGILKRIGFRAAHKLCLMATEPPASRSPMVQEASTKEERSRVSRFMAEQFFARQGANFRRRVEETTMSASDLALFFIEARSQIMAAAMISDEAGVFGLYNLCVAAAHRGCGWGSELLQAMGALAARRGRLLTLQCEASLEDWYTRRGFETVGDVQIHSLPRSFSLDIMEKS